MIVLGANSDISQAFIDKILSENKDKYRKIYLVTSNPDKTERLAKHIQVKHKQESEIIFFDVTKNSDYSVFDTVETDLLFCATGFLGENTEEGLYDDKNTEKIIEINYSKLVPLITLFARKFENRKEGTIIGLSSVAGLRGRQSNFIYGSSKAGFMVYLDGLRNYLFHKNVHVITVLPGFMDTEMTAGLQLPAPLTAAPQKAAEVIYKAYKKKRNKIYVIGIWRFIMLIVRNIPEVIFKKMKM
ncbi:MAG: SDR family NAD(P)-dependent oxidoreductase [Flavobacteriaceae bacterium]|jgi:short-subunit dehydrogenase|nr:SDR family NAD(P)-dependent oxidoreductase [Flavobacteriaceae bacterium]